MSILSHVRAVAVTFVLVGALAVTISPALGNTALSEVSVGASQAFKATSGFHAVVDTAFAQLTRHAPAAVSATAP